MDKITQATYIDLDWLTAENNEMLNFELFEKEMSTHGFEVKRTIIEAHDENITNYFGNYPDGFCQVDIKKGDTHISYRGVILEPIDLYRMIRTYNEYQKESYIRERDVLRFAEILKRPEIKEVFKDILTTNNQ